MSSKSFAPSILALFVLVGASSLSAQGGIFRGTVVDADGEPVQGVEVTVTSEDLGTFRRTLATDKRGAFRIRFQETQTQYDYEMLFEKPGFQSFIVPMSPSAVRNLDEEFVMEESEIEAVESHADLGSVLTGTTNEAIEAFNRGLTAQREQDLATARQEYEAALEVDPALNPALVALAQVLLDQGEYEEALAAAERALPEAARPVDALRVQYQSLRALGRGEEADAIGARLESAEGAVASARRVYNEGGEAFQADDLATALVKFQEAVTLDPSLTEAHHAIATLELANGNHEQAVESAERAVELGSNDVATLRVLYDAYDALGRYDELTEIAPRLAAVDPDYGGAKLVEQAAAAWNSGETGRAFSLSQQALAIDPNLAKAYYFVGLHHASAGANAEAKEALGRFLELAPEDSDAATAREMISYLD